jgi:hypothetical protein
MKNSIAERTLRIASALGLDFDETTTLRRASMTLHRWAEGECGDGNSCISRYDGKTYREFSGRPRMVRIPDRETGALRRIAKLCQKKGLHFYHQTDPRGVALYVSKEPLTDSNYNRGVAVY